MVTIKKPVMLKTPASKAAKKPEKDVAPGPGMKVGKPKKGMEALGKAKIGSAMLGKK